MKTKYFATLILAASIGCGCTNLDETPYTDLPAKKFFEDKELVQIYSGKAYRSLQGYCGEQSLWTLNLQAGDECAAPVNSIGENTQPRYQELQKHDFSVSNKLIRTGWDFCFAGVAECNKVLNDFKVMNLDFADMDKTIAQIKILRAFYYFLATDGWGNIPFSIDASDKSYPPQKDRAFMFAFIEKEIKDNVALLDEVPTTKNYGRFTQGAANTLLAKLYLNAQEWIGQPKWDQAEATLKSVIDLGVYQISNSYKENFSVGNEKSKENIFSIPYSSVYTTGDTKGFTLYMYALDTRNGKKFNIPGSSWDMIICQPDFFQKYDPTDTRRSDTWLYGQQTDFTGAPIADFVIEPIFSDSKYTSGRAANDGAKIWKWTYQTDGKLTSDQVSMDNHFALFRYSDVLYMYAEALIRQSKSTSTLVADANFQKIRTRAALAPLTEAGLTLDALFAERGAELAWEGWRRQDLIRFGKYNDAWWAKSNASEPYKKLYPIPLERLSVNPNLVQNAGYPI